MQSKSVIIVDDESAARKTLRKVIDTFPELEVIAEVDNGQTAISQIEALKPDILFLDIEMPGMNGFDVAQATAHIHYQLVFVTAYQKYALDAFETRAIDYLMKPVRPALLTKCIEKILLQETFAREALESYHAKDAVIVLSDGKTRRLIKHSHVCYIEGIGRYRQIHLTQEGQLTHKMGTIISDTTLDRFEETLPNKQFYRVHRGFIVNVGQIARLFIESKRYVVSFNEVESNVPVSRAKVAELKDLLS